jgi:hypothetical protein
VDVDPRQVPPDEAVEHLRRHLLLRGRQLLPHLAPVALAVGVEVAVVHLGRALDEHQGRALQAAAARIREQHRDLRVRARVVGLLRVAEPGGDVDAGVAGVVVGRERPGDRLPAPVDGGHLRRDEPVEDLLNGVGQRGGHGAI